MMPVRPPNRKVVRKPTDHIMGVSQEMWPFHMVPSKLKNFTPVGTEIRKVMNEKNGSRMAPVTNMWWAHTAMDRVPMERVANTRPT